MNRDDIRKLLKFTRTHEWVLLKSDNIAVVGISDHAQSVLGDIVFISLPEVGSSVSSSQDCAVVESVKSASDVYAPLSGKIRAINTALTNDTQEINRSAYDNWLFEIEFSNPEELNNLLSIEEYEYFVKSTDYVD
ncbi:MULTISPECIES: glycine cleavage system protein GcvH [Candidatus Ichthyocystis]|uniref:glycine cleavage system protein GcvH n=1 Tax=Candidatus Ichthyocystis TaxID=2929841 RepID=UPI000AB70809|nr:MULTISPECIES: glycine cleavage system protein GcvH [Ichthyocystis]